MKEHIGLFFLTIILALVSSLAVCDICDYAYRNESNAKPACSQICGCGAGNGCSCVSSNASECECENCTCNSAKTKRK